MHSPRWACIPCTHHGSVHCVWCRYASSSYGDEYIGPHGDEIPTSQSHVDVALLFPHVKERLDAWQQLCDSVEYKVLMGGESTYGASLGFGLRNGFVEHYWYQVPSPAHTRICIWARVPVRTCACARVCLCGQRCARAWRYVCVAPCT